MKKISIWLVMICLPILLTACGNTKQASETESLPSDSNQQTEIEPEDILDSEAEDHENDVETEDISMKMNVQIGDTSFIATLEDNAATSELIEIMREAPITISMSDYSGFEKVGPLGRSLTTDNHQTTTSAGDIVLYSGNQIVIFYGSNSWSYTRIGKIDDLTGWENALGSGSITAVFSLVE